MLMCEDIQQDSNIKFKQGLWALLHLQCLGLVAGLYQAEMLLVYSRPQWTWSHKQLCLSQYFKVKNISAQNTLSFTPSWSQQHESVFLIKINQQHTALKSFLLSLLSSFPACFSCFPYLWLINPCFQYDMHLLVLQVIMHC